jgi:RHS repeat-associated protein
MMQSAICTTSSHFSRSRYTGKERDTESGNDYFGARYYASSMGRFMSPDWSAKEEPVPYAKLDDPQSLNLYAYVQNNPMVRIDADGHLTWDQAKTGLDVASFIPVVGDVASAASGAISLGQGHYGEAALSFAAAIPVAGVLAEGGKAAKLIGEAGKAIHAEKEAATALKEAGAASKAFSKEKQALVDMAKVDKKVGVSKADMKAYKDLNKSLPDPFPANKVRGPETHSTGLPSSQAPHGHVGPVDHIPVNK